MENTRYSPEFGIIFHFQVIADPRQILDGFRSVVLLQANVHERCVADRRLLHFRETLQLGPILQVGQALYPQPPVPTKLQN